MSIPLSSLRPDPNRQTAHSEFPPQLQSNPFSTRYTQPGAIAYALPAGQQTAGDLDHLVAAFLAAGCRGQIVGAHGTGKSTLLETLVPRLAAHGLCIRRLTLRGGLATGHPQDQRATTPPTVLVVDGFEQLCWWRRQWMQGWTRLRRVGLLVTAHRRVGLPTLYETRVSPASICRLVRQLWPHSHHAISDAEIAAMLERHRGNAREVLFELYDVWRCFTRPAAKGPRSVGC